MTDATGPKPAADPACLDCDHRFAADELAAVTARPDAGDQLLIRCAACGAHNELRTAQGQGFEAQPTIRVVRLVRDKGDEESVFAETVAPGIEALPDDSGEFEID